MPKPLFQSPYDFYDLSQVKRRALIGTCFTAETYGSQSLFFPIELINGNSNYGVRQGLIYVSPVLQDSELGKWFRVRAFSPDDLDMNLDFDQNQIHLRQEIVKWLHCIKKRNATYRGILEGIQAEFSAGIFT